MNQPHKSHFVGVLLITFFVIFLTAFFLVIKNRDAKKDEVVVVPPQTQIQDLPKKIEEKVPCGITVITPVKDQKFDTLKKVSVLVDNTKRAELGCGWTVFEAQAGNFVFIDSSGVEITKGLLTAEDGADWMTANPVVYEGQVAHAQKAKSIPKGMGKLIITEEDPSGQKTPQVIEIPIEF